MLILDRIFLTHMVTHPTPLRLSGVQALCNVDLILDDKYSRVTDSPRRLRGVQALCNMDLILDDKYIR
jgi:hypothetical protein